MQSIILPHITHILLPILPLFLLKWRKAKLRLRSLMIERIHVGIQTWVTRAMSSVSFTRAIFCLITSFQLFLGLLLLLLPTNKLILSHLLLTGASESRLMTCPNHLKSCFPHLVFYKDYSHLFVDDFVSDISAHSMTT